MDVTAATRPAVEALCQEGRHVPMARRIVDADGCVRSTCRFCGGTLKRTAATRSWFFSGELG